jgi:hypothetical protein
MADNEDVVERRRANRNLHVVRRNSSATPWIFGALLLVIVLVVVFWPDRADVDAAVEDFARFVSSPEARDAIGPKHEYTAEGIRRLATAISALAHQDTVAGRELEPRIQALREHADALQRDPNADTHALKTREAFLLAASVLDSIQDRRFPNLDGDATAVLRAAEGVKPRQPLTEQADGLDRFFERTSHLLRRMGSASG